MTRGGLFFSQARAQWVTCLLAAGLAVGLFGLYRVLKGYDAQQWPETEGRVIESHLLFGRRIIGRRLLVRYEYEVEGRRHESTRISYLFLPGTAGDDQAVADRYPAGSAVTVRYNPGNPEDAVIETAMSGRVWWLFVLSGLSLLLGRRLWKHGRQPGGGEG